MSNVTPLVLDMFQTTILRALVIATQCFALFGCASQRDSPSVDTVTEVQGKIVQRVFASVIPGKVRREPGLSGAQRAISAQQEHSALPTPSYEHLIDLGKDQYVVSVSESAGYQEGTCVRVLLYASSKRPRIIEAIPCAS
jgi:hypothetical protein